MMADFLWAISQGTPAERTQLSLANPNPTELKWKLVVQKQEEEEEPG